MQKQILSVASILASVLIFLVGTGLFNTVTPVRAHLAGFSDLLIGIIGSAYYAGFIGGCFVGPRLIARVGHSRTFAVAAGIAAVAPLMQSLLFSVGWWIVARCIFGFAAAGLYMVIESWLNDRATGETRGRIFAAYMTVNYLGIVLGQSLFMTGHATGYSLFSLSSIFYALCLIPMGLTRLPQPKATEIPKLQPMKMFRIAPVGVAGCIAVGLANGAVWTLAPVYAHDHHLTKGMLALFMNAFTLGGALVQIPIGRLSDHVDRRHIIAGTSLLAACVGLALAAFGERSSTYAILIVGVFGMVALPMYGLSIAHANDRLPREMFVEASATLLLINAIAAAIGPVLAALVTDRMGIAWLFVYTAAIHILLAAFVITRIAVKAPPAHETREPFEPMPEAGSPVSIELDPRSPETV